MEMEKEMKSERWMCKDLPEDVLVRILAFLNTVIVVGLRTVCKQWKRLISFHGGIPSDVPLSSTPAFLLSWSHRSTVTNLLVVEGSHDSLPDSCLSAPSVSFLPRISKKNPIKVVVACKSLLCCSYDREPNLFYICNPATSTYIHLPPPNQPTTWDFIAMAFHSSARRCNLVIGRKSLTQHGALNTVVEIYDSLANSWTQLQMTTRPSVNPQGEGVYSNGKFHWINEIHSGLMGSKYDVVAFSVESKEWELISLPHTPEERLQFWQLGGQDGNLVLIYRNSLCFWKLIEDTNGKTSKWSPLPRCLFDLTDDDKITQTCLQVAVNCSGWTLIYLPNKKMAVFDACGRTARKFDKRELSMLAEHGRCPTSVRGFETNNIWWPS